MDEIKIKVCLDYYDKDKETTMCEEKSYKEDIDEVHSLLYVIWQMYLREKKKKGYTGIEMRIDY